MSVTEEQTRKRVVWTLLRMAELAGRPDHDLPAREELRRLKQTSAGKGFMDAMEKYLNDGGRTSS